MARRWKGVLNLSSDSHRQSQRRRTDGMKEFRVFASLACSSSGSLLVPARNAIFFVGDRIKDSGNATLERLSELENIASALLPKLGQAVNLWIMEPSHYMGGFACYENVLPSMTASGEPMGYKPKGLPAARGCVSILQDCLAQVKTAQLCMKDIDAVKLDLSGKENSTSRECSEEKASPFELFLDRVCTVPPTILLGFSKGGVVLNQLLAEIVHFDESLKTHDEWRLGRCSLQDEEIKPEVGVKEKSFSSPTTMQLLPITVEAFLASIEEVHYVDVGLNCQGAYQTDPRVLDGLAKVARFKDHEGFYVGFHGTPRQWQDSNRKWIAMEKNRSLGLLEEAACKYGRGKLHLSERLYFDGQTPNLQMHFEIIEALVLR